MRKKYINKLKLVGVDEVTHKTLQELHEYTGISMGMLVDMAFHQLGFSDRDTYKVNIFNSLLQPNAKKTFLDWRNYKRKEVNNE